MSLMTTLLNVFWLPRRTLAIPDGDVPGMVSQRAPSSSLASCTSHSNSTALMLEQSFLRIVTKKLNFIINNKEQGRGYPLGHRIVSVYFKLQCSNLISVEKILFLFSFWLFFKSLQGHSSQSVKFLH